MKKLTFLLLLLPIIGFGQGTTTLKIKRVIADSITLNKLIEDTLAVNVIVSGADGKFRIQKRSDFAGGSGDTYWTKSGSNIYLADTSDIRIGLNTAYGAFSIAKTFTSLNRHSIDDFSVLSPSVGGFGFGTFDAYTEMRSSVNNDHFQAYQSRLSNTGSGKIDGTLGMAGFYVNNSHTGTDTITNTYGAHFFDVQGTGKIINNYGLKIENLTRGTKNWAIYSLGGNSYHSGNWIQAPGAAYMTNINYSGGWKYMANGAAYGSYLSGATLLFLRAPVNSGGADAAATPANWMGVDMTNGYVGIGTTTPTGKLHVGAGNIVMDNYYNIGFKNSIGELKTTMFADNGTGTYASPNGFAIFHAGATRIAIRDTSGYVGINKVNPSTELDVNGVITATGGNSTTWNTAYGWGNHAGLYPVVANFSNILYVGTGRTYSTIQAAVNAASDGTLIKVGNGTYTEIVTISGKNNITLEGEVKPEYNGAYSTGEIVGGVILNGNIFIYNGSSIAVKNIGINITTTNPYGVFVGGGSGEVRNVTISDVIVKGDYGAGTHGITAESGGTTTVSEVTIRDCKVYYTVFGFIIKAQNVRIDNCFAGKQSTFGYIVASDNIQGASDVSHAKNIYLTGCTSDSAGTVGFSMYSKDFHSLNASNLVGKELANIHINSCISTNAVTGSGILCGIWTTATWPELGYSGSSQRVVKRVTINGFTVHNALYGIRIFGAEECRIGGVSYGTITGTKYLAYPNATKVKYPENYIDNNGNIVSSTVAGGDAASSTPNLRSTTGTGTTDAITFTTGANVERMRILSDGKVGIGTTAPTSKLDLKSTASEESAVLGSELTTSSGWTSSGWTGDYATGFIHTVDSIKVLSRDVTISSGAVYQISFTVTGRTAGTFTVSLGGTVSEAFSATGSTGPKTANNTGDLIFTPTSTFNGTISEISVKAISAINPATFSITDNTGVSNFEIRSGRNTLYNSFVGKESGAYNTTGTQNSAQGYQSLYSNTTGYYNSAQGYQSLYSNTTGTQNSAQGYRSLYSNTTGNYNSAQGVQPLYYNTTGNYNSAQGYRSLYSNTTGYYNSAQGYQSLYSNTTGTQNSAQGVQPLYSNTTGNYNSAQGYRSLYSNTTGNYNSAQGYQSGRFIKDGATGNTTGSNSIFIGNTTKALADGQTNQIVIGDTATGNGSNTVTLGNNAVIKTVLKGNVGIGTTNPTSKLHVNGAIQTGITAYTQIDSTMIAVKKTIYTPANTGEITAGTGITAAMLGQSMYYNGTAAVDITANPQIADGTDGEEITIVGLSDSNTLTLDDGTGLQLDNGNPFTMGAGDVIKLKYIGTLDLWIEISRSNN